MGDPPPPSPIRALWTLSEEENCQVLHFLSARQIPIFTFCHIFFPCASHVPQKAPFPQEARKKIVYNIVATYAAAMRKPLFRGHLTTALMVRGFFPFSSELVEARQATNGPLLLLLLLSSSKVKRRRTFFTPQPRTWRERRRSIRSSR